MSAKSERSRVFGLLDTINVLQCATVLVAFVSMISGWIAPRQLGQIVAMAMFVAATAHATDGVLGIRSGIVRVFGQLLAGDHAKLASCTKIIAGLIAFGLSILGILLFSGRP